jgi:hypothetical protein
MLECQHFLRRARTTPHSSHLPQTRNTLKHSVTAKKIYRNSQFESEFLGLPGLPSQGLLTLTWVTWVTLVTLGYLGYRVTRLRGTRVTRVTMLGLRKCTYLVSNSGL